MQCYCAKSWCEMGHSPRPCIERIYSANSACTLYQVEACATSCGHLSENRHFWEPKLGNPFDANTLKMA